MWCEAGQRDCGYMDIVKYVKEAGLITGAVTIDKSTEQSSIALEETAGRWLDESQQVCRTDVEVCGLVGLGLVFSLANDAKVTIELQK